jgi:hypothetical protein
LEDWKAQVRSDRAVAERAKGILNGEKQVEEAQAAVKEHQWKLAECETQLPKAEMVVAGLERQEAAVREQMIVARAGVGRRFTSSPLLGGSVLDNIFCTVSRRGWQPRWFGSSIAFPSRKSPLGDVNPCGPDGYRLFSRLAGRKWGRYITGLYRLPTCGANHVVCANTVIASAPFHHLRHLTAKDQNSEGQSCHADIELDWERGGGKSPP